MYNIILIVCIIILLFGGGKKLCAAFGFNTLQAAVFLTLVFLLGFLKIQIPDYSAFSAGGVMYVLSTFCFAFYGENLLRGIYRLLIGGIL
jgi:hypothetical protein